MKQPQGTVLWRRSNCAQVASGKILKSFKRRDLRALGFATSVQVQYETSAAAVFIFLLFLHLVLHHMFGKLEISAPSDNSVSTVLIDVIQNA